MRMPKALATLATAVLLAAGSLAGTASPASAAVVNTVVKFEPPSYATSTDYGSYYGLYAKVYEADGTTPVYSGSLTVNTRPIGSTTWKPLFTNTSAYVIEGFQLSESAEYQAVYSGYNSTSQYQDSYTASTSAVFTVKVGRGIKFIQKSKKKACYEVGPLSAPYKNKPVTTSYKVGKVNKWRYKSSFRTNKKSQYCFKVTKAKTPKNVKTPKGPKLKASKTVYVKSGGMAKQVKIQKY